jgi:hypothetical protein
VYELYVFLIIYNLINTDNVDYFVELICLGAAGAIGSNNLVARNSNSLPTHQPSREN